MIMMMMIMMIMIMIMIKMIMMEAHSGATFVCSTTTAGAPRNNRPMKYFLRAHCASSLPTGAVVSTEVFPPAAASAAAACFVAPPCRLSRPASSIHEPSDSLSPEAPVITRSGASTGGDARSDSNTQKQRSTPWPALASSSSLSLVTLQ